MPLDRTTLVFFDASSLFLVISAPPEHVIRQYESVVVEDAHVIAAALGSGSAYLVTVDQRFERRVRASGLPIIARSPKAFLQTVLPDQPDYPAMRS